MHILLYTIKTFINNSKLAISLRICRYLTERNIQDMYKILIADDEGIVITALSYIIDHHFKDTCIYEAAKTGRDVIEKSETFRPDIALMDINMPGINGIEAMKEIRATNPNVILIVVSAYDKFEYAKEALSLGVMRYINKPIQKDEIIDTIQMAIRKIDVRLAKKSNDLEVREKLEIVTPIIEHGIIYAILFEKNSKEIVKDYIKLLNIYDNYGYIMVLQCGNYTDKFAEDPLTNILLQNNYSGIKDIIKEYFNCIVGPMTGNVISILVPCTHEKDENISYKLRVENMNRAHILVKNLNSTFNLSAHFRIAIGSVKHIEDAKESYNEAINALSFTRGAVAHISDLPIKNNYDANYPLKLENALLEAVECGNINLALCNVDKFFTWMVDNYGDRESDIKIKVLEFVLRAENIGFKSQRLDYHFTSRSDYLPTITGIRDYPSLLTWFQDRIKETCRNIASQKEENTKKTVQKAIKYIQENFKKDISLDEVSEHVHISPYYFSKLFKKEQKVNFIDYLTDLRINKAKELLTTTDMSIKEICSNVGYSNPNYFSRSFKKNVGISPTEFKEGLH